jgi:very-short-patch-repair endonuclease
MGEVKSTPARSERSGGASRGLTAATSRPSRIGPGLPGGARGAPRARGRARRLAVFAHAQRFAPTWSERLLWERLRRSRLGVAFRRQLVIGGYIVDFAAPSVRLVVEVDGSSHRDRQRADARRDAALGELGWRVVRVPAQMVEREIDAAVALVVAALT